MTSVKTKFQKCLAEITDLLQLQKEGPSTQLEESLNAVKKKLTTLVDRLAGDNELQDLLDLEPLQKQHLKDDLDSRRRTLTDLRDAVGAVFSPNRTDFEPSNLAVLSLLAGFLREAPSWMSTADDNLEYSNAKCGLLHAISLKVSNEIQHTLSSDPLMGQIHKLLDDNKLFDKDFNISAEIEGLSNDTQDIITKYTIFIGRKC